MIHGIVKGLAGPATHVLVCHTWRYKEREEHFFRSLEESFTVEQLPLAREDGCDAMSGRNLNLNKWKGPFA
eukprot:4674610-Prorocentrum_lima.AAC.1